MSPPDSASSRDFRSRAESGSGSAGSRGADAEDRVELALLIERDQVREATVGLITDEDLRHCASTRYLDQPAPLVRVIADVDLGKRHALVLQEPLGHAAIAAIVRGVDSYFLHDASRLLQGSSRGLNSRFVPHVRALSRARPAHFRAMPGDSNRTCRGLRGQYDARKTEHGQHVRAQDERHGQRDAVIVRHAEDSACDEQAEATHQ
jgi:hypothetical protein